jgi:hypothetical protein
MIPELNGKRALVVEDDVLVGMDFCDILRDYGCIVDHAKQIQEAMHLLEMRGGEYAFATLTIKIVKANVLEEETSLPIADELDRLGVPFLFLTGYDLSEAKRFVADRPKLIVQKLRACHDLLPGILKIIRT